MPNMSYPLETTKEKNKYIGKLEIKEKGKPTWKSDLDIVFDYPSVQSLEDQAWEYIHKHELEYIPGVILTVYKNGKAVQINKIT